MNAASQLLRVLAILGAIAAGVLFYMTNGKIAGLTSDLASAKQSADASQAKLTKALADNQDTVTNTNKAIADYDSQLKAEKQNNVTMTSASEDAQKAVSADEDQIKALKRQAADAEAKAADAQKSAEMVTTLSQQVADQQTQIATLNNTINDLKTSAPKVIQGDTSKSGTATGTDANSGISLAPTNLGPRAPASILSVDTKQWLIALDVGSDNGMQKDAELYLKVGDQNLAVVKVLSTTPTMTTAAIVSTQDIQPGNFSKIATKGLKIDYQHVQ